MTIAENRHHRRRKIKEKRQVAKLWGHKGELLEKTIRMLARTATPCSCRMCGNPRKFGDGDKHGDKKKMFDPIEWQDD